MPTRVITFGEIMLRLTTPGYERFSQATKLDVTFGGAEANVAVALAQVTDEQEVELLHPAAALPLEFAVVHGPISAAFRASSS